MLTILLGNRNFYKVLYRNIRCKLWRETMPSTYISRVFLRHVYMSDNHTWGRTREFPVYKYQNNGIHRAVPRAQRTRTNLEKFLPISAAKQSSRNRYGCCTSRTNFLIKSSTTTKVWLCFAKPIIWAYWRLLNKCAPSSVATLLILWPSVCLSEKKVKL